MLKIRKATEEDFDEILNMASRFWGETQFSEEFEKDHTIHMVRLSLDHDLLVVAEIESNLVGFCAGVKSYILGSTKAMCATETAYWINPEHRAGKNGIALLLFMEKLVKEQGIKYWTMVSMQSSMPEVVGRMYEKLGYVHSETCYTKVFTDGSNHSSGSSGRSSSVLSQSAETSC